MVSYTTYIAVAYRVAQDVKRIDFEGIDQSQDFMTQLGQFWNDNKEQLKQLTEEQTARELQKVIN